MSPNSIRRPRGRPRRRSVNFRTLWWLCRMEALWSVWPARGAWGTLYPRHRAGLLAWVQASGRWAWASRWRYLTGETLDMPPDAPGDS